MAEKCKPCEIYRRICDVYEEAGLSKNIYNWIKQGFTITSLNQKGHLWSRNTPVKKKFQL